MIATRERSFPPLGEIAWHGGKGESWLEHAVKCEYLPQAPATKLFRHYDHIIGKLVTMQNNPQPWLLIPRRKRV